MRVSFAHGSDDRARVREQIESAIPKLLAEAGGRAEAVEYAWEGDTLRFSFRALGRSLRGSAAVTDTEIVVDMGLPLVARPFEGRVKSHILEVLREVFA